MTDTPIAEQLAADLGLPWPPLSWHMHGDLYTPEGTLMGKPTPEDLQKLRDAIEWEAQQGNNTTALENIHNIGAAQAATEDGA